MECNRRRFLVATGGTSLLAGCAAESIDDDQTDDEDESDTVENESEDDEGQNESTEESNGSDESQENETEQDDSNEGPVEKNDTEESGDDTDENRDNDDQENETEDGATDENGEADENDDTDGDNGDGTDDERAEVEAPPTSEITIQVTDTDGEPVEGAEIHGEGEPHDADIPLEFDGETDAEGVHSTPIYENEYTIKIHHSDFESSTIEHTHDGDTEVTVELEPDVEEPPTSEITVRIYDVSGEGIEGAEVVGEGEPHPADIPLEFEGETDEDGVLSTPIYENEYTIAVSHPDYATETVEHTHDGETEVVVELEDKDEDGEDYENEIINETPLEVDEIRTQDGYAVAGCSVVSSVSSDEEIPVQFDYEFIAYDGDGRIAEFADIYTIQSNVEGTEINTQFQGFDNCNDATHYTLRVDNYQEVDHDDGSIESEVSLEPDAEGVLSVENHEFDDELCRITVDLVNESDESIVGIVQFLFTGEREKSNEMDAEFEPGENRSFVVGVRNCAELESYELHVDIE